MRFFYYTVFLPLLVHAAVLQKRATQVYLRNHTFSNNVLAGSIAIQNIAPTKTVTVTWTSNNWSSSGTISARYEAPSTDGYETWTFSGNAAGAVEFYIRYIVNGQSYYDPGNNVNHKVVSSNPSDPSSTATSSTATDPSPTGTPGSGSGPIPAILPSNIPTEPETSSLTGCGTWNGQDSCKGGEFEFAAVAESRRWQTPPKGDATWRQGWEDYSHLVGYADVVYDSGMKSATVRINAATKDGSDVEVEVDGAASGKEIKVQEGKQGLKVVLKSGSKRLELDEVRFVWQNQKMSGNGQKGAIVELFGWPYEDVGKECEFLGKAGYMGVKVWPPNEHAWGSNQYEPDGQFRPWYLVYQPVSYRFNSRSGTRDQLRKAIDACRAAGVRVYADAVVNHMTGQGTDVITSHRTSSCVLYEGRNATGNSPYYTSGNTYLTNSFTKRRPTLEFPAVPFGPTDFHCERTLDSWTDGNIITKGWLVGLTDLNTEKPYVQDRIATYLVDLINIGFSGFRIDAAKHIGPASTAAIFGRVKDKLGGSLPEDFISWLEIIMGGEADMLACSGGEWSWYTNLDNQLRNYGLSNTDVAKIKIWSSDYPKEFPICGRWILPPSRFAIQNDDHDQQSDGSSSRDMGDKGSVLIKEKDVAKHRDFEIQLFTRTDGDWAIKLILSSYLWAEGGGNGFPDGLSDCATQYTGTAPISGCRGIGKDQAYVANACAYTMTAGKYTRPHRDVRIINAMRGWMGLGSVSASQLGIGGCS